MNKLYSQLLDRPVFIMAAPRSGSTLLFETLIKSTSLHSTGDESHGLIETFPGLRPENRSPPSNFLDANDATEPVKENISRAFATSLVDYLGQKSINPAEGDDLQPIRMIEKTPKNILRIPFFDELYPDALFIYLYRDPLENISSIIDGWHSGHFVTYPGLQVAAGPWSFLLPPGWEKKKNDPVEKLAAWQWINAHEHAIKAFTKIGQKRIFCLNYDDFLAHSAKTVKQLCVFMDIPYDSGLAEHCSNPLPLSRYTLTEPQKDKWKKNAAELARVMEKTRPTIKKINQFADMSSPLAEEWTLQSLKRMANGNKVESKPQAVSKGVSRNAACPCGSGKKFKRCHGDLTAS